MELRRLISCVYYEFIFACHELINVFKLPRMIGCKGIIGLKVKFRGQLGEVIRKCTQSKKCIYNNENENQRMQMYLCQV